MRAIVRFLDGGATLRAAMELKRNSYGFEVSKQFYKAAQDEMLNPRQLTFDLVGCGV